MNQDRRKRIIKIIDELDTIQILLDELSDEEGEAFNGMIPARQEGEAGQSSQVAFDSLREATLKVEEAIEELSDIDGCTVPNG